MQRIGSEEAETGAADVGLEKWKAEKAGLD